MSKDIVPKGKMAWTDWKNMSIMTQILIYIFLVYGIFSLLFLPILYFSAGVFVEQTTEEIVDQYSLTIQNQIQSILNETISSSKYHFSQQDQLMKEQGLLI